jgi:hypothetical protein
MVTHSIKRGRNSRARALVTTIYYSALHLFSDRGDEFYWVRDNYQKSYDDIVEGRNIADLLFMVKIKSYETYLARQGSKK